MMGRVLLGSCLSLVLGGGLIAQTTHYETSGFESPGFQLGRLAGEDLWSGQDGWLVTPDIWHDTVNLDGILVQDQHVRFGRQAGSWDASVMDFDYAHLRRNEIFGPPPGEPRVEILMDFYLTESETRSEQWGIDVYAAPLARLTRWTIDDNNEVRMLDPGPDADVHTGFFVQRDRWYRSRTSIDLDQMTATVYLDGVHVYTAGVIDQVPMFSFAAIYLGGPGDDRMDFDEFAVRSTPENVLTSDRDRLPLDGGQTHFTLESGPGQSNRDYLLLGGISGTSPGTPLPGGLVTLPLNWDLFTNVVVTYINTPTFAEFLGSLDGQGRARATFEPGPLPPEAVGVTMFYAYALRGPFDTVSNPVMIDIVP